MFLIFAVGVISLKHCVITVICALYPLFKVFESASFRLFGSCSWGMPLPLQHSQTTLISSLNTPRFKWIRVVAKMRQAF